MWAGTSRFHLYSERCPFDDELIPGDPRVSSITPLPRVYNLGSAQNRDEPSMRNGKSDKFPNFNLSKCSFVKHAALVNPAAILGLHSVTVPGAGVRL
jgi:hypothetical protein